MDNLCGGLGRTSLLAASIQRQNSFPESTFNQSSKHVENRSRQKVTPGSAQVGLDTVRPALNTRHTHIKANNFVSDKELFVREYIPHLTPGGPLWG